MVIQKWLCLCVIGFVSVSLRFFQHEHWSYISITICPLTTIFAFVAFAEISTLSKKKKAKESIFTCLYCINLLRLLPFKMIVIKFNFDTAKPSVFKRLISRFLL